MRSPSSAFQTTIAGDKMAPVLLVELTGSVRYALYPQNVTFNSNAYTATDGAIGTVQQNAEGRAPSFALTMQNIDRTMRDWLEATDKRGTDVILRLVFTDDLSDATSVLEWTYELDAYRYDNRDVQLDLVSSPMVTGLQVPGRRAHGWYCPWSYKGTECGYLGSLKTCDFTYDDCAAHFGDDPKRFGGFLGRPRADLVVF